MQTEERGSGIFVAGFLLAALGLVVAPLALIGIIAAVRDDGGGSGSSSTATTAAISLKEFSIAGQLSVPAGDVTLNVKNDGSQVHNLYLRGGKGTKDISPGASDTLALGKLKAGSYEVVCLIPGHEAAGMKATLDVTEGGSSAAAAGGTAGHSGTIDYAKLDKAMEDSIKKFPAKTAGQGNTELKPTILADGTKQFNITTEIIDWEVEPGKIVKAWAYNGQVPGPVIRTEVGDKVKLVVTNKLPMGTDVHVHGIDMPFKMDGVSPITQPLIEPGTTFTYEFTTPRQAVAMYHAHHHGQMQVPNGLFGVFITGDMPLPAGKTISGVTIPKDIKIAKRIPMVLNDAGVIGLSLNGKGFPATEPYTSKVGDWIMVDYFNEGLQIHPMHQHRFFQLVIAKDGIPLEQPYWVDTLNVAPGERYTVIMKTDEKGVWVWHCHILNHVEREEGAFGMLTAFIVE